MEVGKVYLSVDINFSGSHRSSRTSLKITFNKIYFLQVYSHNISSEYIVAQTRKLYYFDEYIFFRISFFVNRYKEPAQNLWQKIKRSFFFFFTIYVFLIMHSSKKERCEIRTYSLMCTVHNENNNLFFSKKNFELKRKC